MKSQHLLAAIGAALSAGAQIMKVYAAPQEAWEVEQKADHSPLTLADRRAHDIIVRALATTPWPVLSEEGAHLPYAERSTWEALWVVDPLDGTKEFIKRNGEFTVNIALVRGGVPVAGVVYVPATDVLYVGAAAGELGAERPLAWRMDEASRRTLTDVAQRPEHVTDLTQAHRLGGESLRVVASRSHLSAATEAWIEALQERTGRPVELCSAGSSLKLCLLAERRADLYPRLAPTMEWDTAAGDALLRAAGGHTELVADGRATGQPIVYNKPDLHNPHFLATAPGL